MQQETNTVHMKLYTPSGVPLNFVISIRDGKLTETLPDVATIDAMIAASGYLLTAPGALPGEELETITHVILRIQHNKSDGTQTPCIGMYYENPKLVYCKKAYLNTPEDIATFERLSGLKLAQLPKFPGQFPKRDDLSATEYILAAKTPFQIRMTDGTYTDDATGETKSTKVFAGFYDVSSKPQATQATTVSGNGNAGSGKQDAGESGSKWTDNLQQMDWLKQTIITMRETYGDVAIDSAKAAIKITDYTTAREYADGLVEQLWYPRMMEASKFLYIENGEHNVYKHTASIDKRLQDTGDYGISADMTLYEVLSRLIRYRALHDLFIDSGDYQNIFGMPFADYYEMHGAGQTWQRINEFYAAQMTPAKTKAS